MLEIGTRVDNAVMSVFGDDAVTEKKDGFEENEPIYFKIYHSKTGEENSLNVVFDQSMPNTNQIFINNGLSAITSIEESSTSLNDQFSESNILVIPNPARNEFTLDLRKKIGNPGELTIYKIDGRIIGHIDLKSQQTEVNISNYEPGVYLLEIKVNDQTFVKRLIKH